MNYYERHLGDFAKDTAHLSALEIGVYDLLLDRYYATEKPIPACDVYRIGRARSADEKAAVEAVLAEFFHLQMDGWVQGRVEAEIAKFREKSNKASDAADARWKRSKGISERAPNGDADACANADASADANAQPDAMRTVAVRNAPQSPVTSNQKDQEHGPAAPCRFADFWRVYPKKANRKDALKAWKSRRLDGLADELIADVQRRARLHKGWLDGYIPHASTYLRGERWEDEIEVARGAGSELPKETV